jgi:hypothetical protein
MYKNVHVLRENKKKPATSYWQMLWHKIVSSAPCHQQTPVVIGTDCTDRVNPITYVHVHDSEPV